MTADPPTPPSPASSDDLLVDWAAAYTEERKHIGIDDAATQPAALCLSGGGVRSAAFCLGVLNSLADREHRLLQHFHYLSTVSGGGYIGSWLTRFIADRPDPADRTIPKVAAEIGKHASDGEAAPIRRLRRYTRFLAPQAGLLSLDTLAGFLLWMRNTLVNWFVFLPIFGAAVTLPLLHFAATAALASGFGGGHLRIWIAIGVALCLTWGAAASILYLPSQYYPDPETDAAKPDAYGATSPRIFWMVIVPMLVWCSLVPLTVAHAVLPRSQARHAHAVFGTVPSLLCTPGTAMACQRVDREAPAVEREALRIASRALATAVAEQACGVANAPPATCVAPKRASHPALGDLWPLPALNLGACVLAYLIALARVSTRHYKPLTHEGKPVDLHKKHTTVLKRGFIPWLAGAVLSSAMLWWGIGLARDAGLFWLAIAGPLWVALAEALRTTVFVALRHKRLRGDLDREWLARLNGTKLVIVLAGTAGGAVVVVGGALLATLGSGALKTLAGGGLASGGLVAWIGRSAATAFAARAAGGPGSGFQLPLSALANLAVITFGAILFALIGHGMATLIGSITVKLTADPVNPSLFLIFVLCLVLTIFCAGLAWLLGWAINLNRFSMHAVYRNRLIRAFLGSARDQGRRPDRYTGFDPTDNLRMADAFDRPADKPRYLFPVINVALNRTVGDDPARAERKADSFTITPLRCGSAALHLPPADAGVHKTRFARLKDWFVSFGREEPAGTPQGAYVRSADYAGDERQTGVLDKHRGISLGTAMTISGAAASPNMGYNSSPLIASVMTLFNVRLGAWLPNPGVVRKTKKLARGGPPNAVPTLLSDLLGRSSVTSQYIYLSDGGHFDNLGIYEMLRRRCGLILAIDAGQDQHYAYEDLTRTIEYARIDLGAEITFLPPIRVGNKELEAQGAFATIRYRTENGLSQTGRLVYLKSWLPPEAPVELLAMKARKTNFPHESTLNQFFTESDFESYRGLGEYLMDCLTALAAKRDGIQAPAPSAPTGSNAWAQAGSQPPSNELTRLFDRLYGIASAKRQQSTGDS